MHLSLPTIYERLFESHRTKAIEHSLLNAKTIESLLGLALKDLFNFRDVDFFTPDIEQVKYFLSVWGVKSKSLYRSKERVILGVNDSQLCLSSRVAINGNSVYGVEAQKLHAEEEPSRGTFSGVFCEKDHWFYSFARKAELLIRVNAEQTLCHWPKQSSSLFPHDPMYPRLMALKDINPIFGTKSFLSFARDRLSIRSDKPSNLLSNVQKKQIEGQQGTPVISLDVSALQKRYLAKKRLAKIQGKKPWFILLKYRRGGFTTIEQALSYQMCATKPRSYVATLAHTKEASRRIFRIVSLYREEDPQAEQYLDSDSKSALEFKNGSYFFIGTAGGQGFGRGDTLQKVHGSEVAKWLEGPHQVEDVDDLVAALAGAVSNGEFILESTPNGKEWFYKAYMEAKEGASEFTPIFLRWFDDPMNVLSCNKDEIIETETEEEKKLKLKPEQVAFRRQAKKIYGRLFAQEMPEDDVSCFISSGICFFDSQILMHILENIPDNDGVEYRGGIKHIWQEPIPGIEYAMGVDTSEGLSTGDLNGAGILRRDTGEQVASIHGMFSPRELADHVVKLAIEYNDALVGVERENHGHAVLQKIADFSYTNVYSYAKNRIGWTTNASTRPLMLDELAEAVEDGHMKCNDIKFIQECLSFRKQSSGKYEADPGAYDDRVMKWAIAWQMRKERTGALLIQPL